MPKLLPLLNLSLRITKILVSISVGFPLGRVQDLDVYYLNLYINLFYLTAHITTSMEGIHWWTPDYTNHHTYDFKSQSRNTN